MKIKNLNESFRRLYEEACEDCEDELTFEDIDFNPSVEGELTEAKISPEDKHESDLSEYQKWVDYDMEKYHRISDITMKKIKKAGLSIVKDQYGEYEVIADRRSKKNESYLRESWTGSPEDDIWEAMEEMYTKGYSKFEIKRAVTAVMDGWFSDHSE